MAARNRAADEVVPDDAAAPNEQALQQFAVGRCGSYRRQQTERLLQALRARRDH
jgi:hypothetical protein